MIESAFVIEAAAKGLGVLITSLVKDKGGETLTKLDWDIGKNLDLRKATKDYIRRYVDRHGTLKVACVRMDNPVRLDQVYTAVQLLDRPALRYFDSEQALQEQYRESGKHNFYQHPCIPVMLELRQFEQTNRSIKAVIASELDTCGFREAEELTELFLKNGKLLLRPRPRPR